GRVDPDSADSAQQPGRHRTGARRQVHRPRIGFRPVIRPPLMFTGRVARQVFLLFILCAFVPFAVIATLSYFQLRELHLQSGQQRLAVASKQYGMGVYERLLSAAEIARNAADFPDQTERVRKLAQPRFRSLGFVDAKGHAHSLLGSAEAPTALDERA